MYKIETSLPVHTVFMMKKTFLLILTLAAAAFSVQAHAANEVKLLRAHSTVSTRYGMSVQQPRFDVLVANLAYAKQVYVHLKKPDGNWIDVPLAFNRPADNGREVWSGAYMNTEQNALTFKTFDLEYSIKFMVDGKTYWDNNGGKNYLMARDSGNFLNGLNVFHGDWQPSVSAYGTQFYGAVTVRNIAYSKQIKVVYSTDGWLTSKTAFATFNPYIWYGSYSSAANPNQYGFEEWNFALDVGNANEVQYAIAYIANGQTYWDNNFGRNFKTSIQH